MLYFWEYSKKVEALMNGAIVKKISHCNYQYGHILICKAQGRITDEKLLEERFVALEEKIESLLKSLPHEITVNFNRKLKPPDIFQKFPPWTHTPYFPLKFIRFDMDISYTFQIEY